MVKRSIKPAAGRSRVSIEEATSAARIVYRDSRTGRFVIIDGGGEDRKPRRGPTAETHGRDSRKR